MASVLAPSSAPVGVLASVSQLVEGRAADVECDPANNGQEESGNDAHAVVTCRAVMLSTPGLTEKNWHSFAATLHSCMHSHLYGFQ